MLVVLYMYLLLMVLTCAGSGALMSIQAILLVLGLFNA